MGTVVLVVHLILALSLIGVVLLQRSEGGGLGMGAGGVMTGRGQATALGRATWWVAGAFIATSVALTVIAAENAGGGSVVDQLQAPASPEEPATLPDLGGDGSLLPPPTTPVAPATDAPLVPGSD